MQITNEELGKHYASLSDGELEEIDPAELTDVARKVYELEIRKRRLAAASPRPLDEDGVAVEIGEESDPDWLGDAECVCSFRDSSRAGLAQEFLLASGVPCQLSLVEIDAGSSECQVMVPAGLHLKAKTVLDVQIFNAQEEEGIKAHLAGLSDEDLRALSLDDLCGGLRDMLERVTKAYNDEIAGRYGARRTGNSTLEG